MLRWELQLRELIEAALIELGIQPRALEFVVERPQHEGFGDFSTNVALIMAKSHGKSPRELASELIETSIFTEFPYTQGFEVAGPGFINFKMKAAHLHMQIHQVLQEGEASFGRVDLGKGEKVQIEFVSANPTGPLHIGNGWWAAYGDALSRVLKRSGFEVTKEYYVNDTGGQIRSLGESILARKEGSVPPEGGYLGDYVVDLAKQYEGSLEVAVAGRWAAEHIIEEIKASLEDFGVNFDVWYSQASIEDSGAVEDTIAELDAKGFVYEQDGALWLRSSDLGDSRDRVLRKSNGDFTYLAGDIAYHRNKFLIRGFDRVIDIFGADHHGQVASQKAAMNALGIDPTRLEILLGQMVSVVESNQVVKMSKRAGTSIPLSFVVDKLGVSATRILCLSSSLDKAVVLDLTKAVEKSMDNPAFYIQYAHARIVSLLKMAFQKKVSLRPLSSEELATLTHPREIKLMKDITLLPEVIEVAARERAPHKVTTWLKSTASSFHGFYHDCPILADDLSDDIVQSRLALARATQVALRVGLELVGADAVEEM